MALLMSIAAWNILGLAMSLLGVLILFRYGMPFRVRTEGVGYIARRAIDEKERARDRSYTILGYIGLALVVLGTFCQMYAAYHA
jgi:hypothetical protein